jgi:hypothetical protein
MYFCEGGTGVGGKLIISFDEYNTYSDSYEIGGVVGRFYLMRNRTRRIEQHLTNLCRKGLSHGRGKAWAAMRDSAEGGCLPRQNNRLDAVSGIVLE